VQGRQGQQDQLRQAPHQLLQGLRKLDCGQARHALLTAVGQEALQQIKGNVW
jgi:hypothetical protein